MTVLAFGIGLFSAVQYGVLGAASAGFIMQKLQDMHLSNIWYVFLYVHASSSVISLLIGPFTLSRKFREVSFKRHKTLGKIYLAGVWTGGLSGMYLAWYATGGIVAQLGFGTLATLWIATSCMAYAAIRNKRIERHRQWMMRNYALTFAAVTLRLYIPLSILFWGLERYTESYTAIAWLCWVPNLLVVEALLRRRGQRRSIRTA